MKVTVIANISVNGRVLLSDNPTHQLPPEAMKFYLEYAHRVGNLVIGLRTFENFQKFSQETQNLFKDIEIIVLSSKPSVANGYVFVKSPEEAIAYMASRGIKEIAVGGGTGTFNAFINKELVTDIYFNISPVVTGHGGVFGSYENLNSKFKVTEHKFNDGFIKLHLSSCGS